jgi:hypothetical protein
MAAADNTRQLLRAVARLTSDPGRNVRHGVLFRIEVESKDGHRCAVTLQVNDHRDRPSKAALNDLADRFRLAREQIAEVLESWSHNDLREHLSGLSADELKPPAHGRRGR